MLGPNVKTSSSILNEGGIVKLVYIPLILVGASLEVRVTYLMENIPGTYN